MSLKIERGLPHITRIFMDCGMGATLSLTPDEAASPRNWSLTVAGRWHRAKTLRKAAALLLEAAITIDPDPR